MKVFSSLTQSNARKVHGSRFGSAGEPDIDACVRGRTVKIEVKAPGRRGNVTAIQKKRLETWAAAGAVTGVVCDEQELVDILLVEELATREELSRWLKKRK
jgi:hypothetical protein